MDRLSFSFPRWDTWLAVLGVLACIVALAAGLEHLALALLGAAVCWAVVARLWHKHSSRE